MTRLDRFVWGGALGFTATAAGLLSQGEWFRRGGSDGGRVIVLG